MNDLGKNLARLAVIGMLGGHASVQKETEDMSRAKEKLHGTVLKLFWVILMFLVSN